MKPGLSLKSLETLEFNKIRERLATFAAFSASRELALALLPSPNPDEVAARQQATAEARLLLDLKPGLSVGGAHDIRPLAQRAAVGGVLEPNDLLAIQSTLAAARSFRTALASLGDRIPYLWGKAQRMVPLPQLEADIARSIGPSGEVLDSASPALGLIRRKVREAHDQLMAKLKGILNSPRGRRVLQEPIITERRGRYVVPIRVELRGELKGIVHDISASGATLFIEPLSVIEFANAWRELKLQEEREIERVLSGLSAQVSSHATDISVNVACLAELDLALAKAKYALSQRATQPILAGAGSGADGRLLRLGNARHPLLTGRVVPISVEIGRDFSILLITGPNTGGKTVTLKTVGVRTIMTLAGLFIPADDGSQIPIFDAVYADIGDEQNIEQALSTFSSHMGNIRDILKEATASSLVLLDELATSTDPAEGSALARAIMRYLLARGITTVATTHLSELKAFVQTTPGMQNASVEFDPVTLAPTYKLSIGLPGRSNAIATATQLGLPAEIIEEAKTMLSPSHLEIDRLLADIQRERDEASQQRLAQEHSRTEAERLQQALVERLHHIDEERRQVLEEARLEALEEVDSIQQRLRRLQADLETAATTRGRLTSAASELKAIRRELRAPLKPASEEAAPPVKLARGQRVWLRGVERPGILLAPPDDAGDVEVQFGSLKMKVGQERIERVEEARLEPGPAVALSTRPTSPPSLELQLRGRRAEEVAPELERYLNDAFLAHLPRVRIVHGKGTGTLRQIVRDMLSHHPLVKSFSPAPPNEGGDGATVVELVTWRAT